MILALVALACAPEPLEFDGVAENRDAGPDALGDAGADGAQTVDSGQVPPGSVLWAVRAGGWVAKNAGGTIVFKGDLASRSAGGVHAFLSLSNTTSDIDAVWLTLDSNGAELLRRPFGDSRGQLAYGIVRTAQDDVWLSGTLEANSTIDFGEKELKAVGRTTMFLAEYTEDGEFEEASLASVTQSAYGGRLAASGSTLLFTGAFQGDLTYGAISLSNPNSARSDGFSGALEAGSVRWLKRAGFVADDQISAVCATPGGESIEIVNEFLDTWQSASNSVVRLRGPDGEIRWDLPLLSVPTDPQAKGPGTGVVATGCAVGPAGEVFVVGSFWDKLSFGGDPTWTLAAQPQHDAFVAKLDATGSPIWLRHFSGDQGQWALATALSADGSTLFVGGGFDGETDFGDGPVAELYPQAISTTAYVLALDASTGALRWKALFGGMDTNVHRLVSDASGTVYAMGTFQGTVDFGSAALSSQSDAADVFILALEGDSGDR